jgi:hypothetical protein
MLSDSVIAQGSVIIQNPSSNTQATPHGDAIPAEVQLAPGGHSSTGHEWKNTLPTFPIIRYSGLPHLRFT